MLKTDAVAKRFDAIHMRSMCSSRIRRRLGRLLLRALFWAVFVHAAAAALLALSCPLLGFLRVPWGSFGFPGRRGGAATFGGPKIPRASYPIRLVRTLHASTGRAGPGKTIKISLFLKTVLKTDAVAY